MPGWGTFVRESPALAARARERLHNRVAYLATTRADGSPRVHPVTPIVADRELFLFMEPTSPKGRDLRRDGRYQLHAGVEDQAGGAGELFVRGTAAFIDDRAARERATGASPYRPAERYVLFALDVDEAMLTSYATGSPERVRWRARDTVVQ